MCEPLGWNGMSQGILKANLCLYANINYSLSNAFKLEQKKIQVRHQEKILIGEIVFFWQTGSQQCCSKRRTLMQGWTDPKRKAPFTGVQCSWHKRLTTSLKSFLRSKWAQTIKTWCSLWSMRNPWESWDKTAAGGCALKEMLLSLVLAQCDSQSRTSVFEQLNQQLKKTTVHFNF